MNLLLNKKQWLIVGISALLAFLAYKFVSDWRWTIPNNSELIISLRRTECFGYCPAYKVTLYDNGTVVYEGFGYVGVRGIRKANIGAEAVQKLATELENAGYFLLEDRYNEPMYTETSSIYTSVKIGDKEKQIEHDTGDPKAPEELYRLEQLIDDTANSTRWVNACSLWHPNSSCSYNLVFWIMMVTPLVIALSIVRLFIKQRRAIVGIIVGEAIVAAIWLCLVQLASSRDLFGSLWSTTVFYSVLGVSEFVAILLIGLFLLRRYKGNAIQKSTG